MTKIGYFLLFSMLRISALSNFKEKLERKRATNLPCQVTFIGDKDEVIDVKCVTPEDGEYVIPKDLQSNLTNFALTNKYDNPTLITKIDTFERFFQLKNLSIDGSLKFAAELVDSQKKQQTLREQFFHISTLKHLHLQRCKFDGVSISEKQSLILPPHILTFELKDCDEKYFNWQKVVTLKSLSISNKDFRKMPTLGYPSLRHLNVEDSPIFITVDSLAVFCNLTTFHFDDRTYHGSEKYCECERLRQWYLLLKKQPKHFLDFKPKSGDFNCNAEGKETSCSKYTLDEAIKIRTTCLSTKPSIEGNLTVESANAPTSPSKKLTTDRKIKIFFIIALIASSTVIAYEEWLSRLLYEE